MPRRPPLGAPGIYHAAADPLRALTGVRMDVCAFVGVAPRGPARVPVVDERWPDDRPCVEPGRPRRRSAAVPVESWDDYLRHFGGFEGPGLLPYAVASFFEQGGRRAYVVRIVHAYGTDEDAAGVAAATLAGITIRGGGAPVLRARSEGRWGDGLRAELTYAARPLFPLQAGLTEVAFAPDTPLAAGALLRLALPDGERVLRFVAGVRLRGKADSPRRELVATLDVPAPADPVGAELVEAALEVDDGAGRRERHDRLALSPLHRRFLATVLCYESELLYPDSAWAERELDPAGPGLDPAAAARFDGGEDRYRAILPEDFLDAEWVLGDEEPGDGVHALVHLDDLALVVCPDLYSPGPLVPIERVVAPATLAGPEFAPCAVVEPPPAQAEPTEELEGLRLDPTLPADLKAITALQRRLERLADDLRSFIVLLDVPPGLSQRRILSWRSEFGSAFAAAYHPWLAVARRDDSRDALVRVNPAAIAAGIVARRERAFGVPYGPFNELAAGVVDVDDDVSPLRHDELHPLGINIFARERDGVRLTAGRTLARDADYRQLSIRRLMTMLRRVLEQQLQWLVFEPNSAGLRSQLRDTITSFLRQLHRANAFAGATEYEAFFVRCDDTLNPPPVVDAGRLVAEVGVAPAEPLEFLVLRIAREGDGTLLVETVRA
jgi:hypothetical protein